MTLSSAPVKELPNAPHRPPQARHHSALSEILQRLFPDLHRKFKRTVTMPRSATLLPADTVRTSQGPHKSSMVVPYLSFPTIVGRNSVFHGLTEAQLEELGGIEFRALNMLMWAVPLVCYDFAAICVGPPLNCCQYYLFSLAIPFAIVAPYISASRWEDTFSIPTQHRNISPVWRVSFGIDASCSLTFPRFSLCQIVGAWANTGMSLVE